MTETEIQKQIIETLHLNGCVVLRMNSGKGRNNQTLCPEGTPDLLCITRRGVYYWIEVKTETGKLRDSQKETIADLKSRGCHVIVARDINDVSWIR